ncbi:MAG: hypothetical protein AUJ49_08465 [Desulfovibrionaceae bacterium CG1_02_65_16]|nr:MAG: hypothetical protein AUJ49_08465 [Desulfovibrionaceae bacterium CG1_02_65_16]
MNLLNKDAILKAKDLKTERITVKEWGGEVIVSEMDGETLAEFYALIFPEDEKKEDPKMTDARFHATAIAFSVVDESGRRIFGADDIPALAKKSRVTLKRVFAVADRLSIISVAAREAAEKNSVAAGDGAEPSSSLPESSASQA